MKIKSFIVVSVSVMIIISAFLISWPYLSANKTRSELASTPTEGGSFLLYEFTDYSVYMYINGTPTLLSQTGIINITSTGNAIKMTVAISGPPYKGSPKNFTYTSFYKNSYETKITNNFVSNFINKVPRKEGGIVDVDKQMGIVTAPFSTPYHLNYGGSNRTILGLTQKIGFTKPSVLKLINLNEESNKSYYPFTNYYQYDNSHNWNVLVSMSLFGSTYGLNAFIGQLLNNTNVNRPVLKVMDFNLYLIGSNIALNPLDAMHYLGEYSVFVAFILVFGSSYIGLTVRMARKKYRSKK